MNVFIILVVWSYSMPKLLLFPSSVLRTVPVEGKGQCSPIKMHCRWAFASNAVLIHREHVATLCNQLLERTVAENIKQPSSSTIALSTVISLLPEDSLRIFTKNVHSERKGCIGLSSLTNALRLHLSWRTFERLLPYESIVFSVIFVFSLRRTWKTYKRIFRGRKKRTLWEVIW